MYKHHIPGGNPGGQDHLNSVGWQIEQGSEPLIQFTTDNVEGYGIDEGLKVIQQQYHLTRRECFQKCLHFQFCTGFGVPVYFIQPSGHIIGQQAGKVSIQIGYCHLACSCHAQIHNTVNMHLFPVIRQLPPFQGLEQSAYHCGLPDPCPPHNGHQALGIIVQEIADKVGLNMPVLEIGGSYCWWMIDEFRMCNAAYRSFRLALPLDSPGDALFNPFCCSFRVIDDTLLIFDLFFQERDLILDSCLLVWIPGPAQITVVVFKPVLQGLQHPLRRGQPSQMAAQSCQTCSKITCEINVLSASQTEGHFSIRLEKKRDNGFFIFERPGPLKFAYGFIFHTVIGHDKHHTFADADRLNYLFVPILSGV